MSQSHTVWITGPVERRGERAIGEISTQPSRREWIQHAVKEIPKTLQSNCEGLSTWMFGLPANTQHTRDSLYNTHANQTLDVLLKFSVFPINGKKYRHLSKKVWAILYATYLAPACWRWRWRCIACRSSVGPRWAATRTDPTARSACGLHTMMRWKLSLEGVWKSVLDYVWKKTMKMM